MTIADSGGGPIRIALKNPETLQAAIAQLGRGVSVGVEACARQVAASVAKEVARSVPVDTGRLRAGWQAAAEAALGGSSGEGGAAIEQTETMAIVSVEVSVPHAAYIEHGTELIPPGSQLDLALANATRENVRTWQELFVVAARSG